MMLDELIGAPYRSPVTIAPRGIATVGKRPLLSRRTPVSPSITVTLPLTLGGWLTGVVVIFTGRFVSKPSAPSSMVTRSIGCCRSDLRAVVDIGEVAEVGNRKSRSDRDRVAAQLQRPVRRQTRQFNDDLNGEVVHVRKPRLRLNKTSARRSRSQEIERAAFADAGASAAYQDGCIVHRRHYQIEVDPISRTP